MSVGTPSNALADAGRCANPRPIPILVYHQIALAPPRGAPYRSLYVSPQAFARQMRWLKRWGWQGLSMPALMPYLRGQKTGRVVGITFDDGYRNNLEHAAPVLQALGFSATCYAVSAKLGGANDWDASQGIAAAALMDAAELRQWCAAGLDVGAHTRQHRDLCQCSMVQAKDEISLSKTELSAQIGQSVEHFCYPYGRFDASHRAQVAQAGFASATSTERGRAQAGDDLLALPRVPVLRATTLPVFWLKLATPYEDRYRRLRAA
ncbi:MAG: polysaccharide deacetylase family protein [Rhodoferax sp.]